MRIPRRFTQPDTDVFSTVEWITRTSRITNADGSVVFEMNDAEVPAQWSQLATDIMVSKYFRKAGVPVDGGPNGIAAADCAHEDAVKPQANIDSPSPQPSPNGRGGQSRANRPRTGPEKSARQVIHRLAGCWRHWGEAHGYFDTPEDAQAFYDELCYMMLRQMAAPNSPQWFNTGLNWAYGISGPPQGHWVCDPDTGAAKLATDAYTHPQPHACFIQSVGDDLVGEGGIMDLWTREARLFKYGSGTGTNFSSIRGENEPLSGGGKSSGLMSFLKIGDRAAGAIKSGGTTRRAAKMVCLDADHPDIEDFVNWKVREELKVAALAEGLKRLTEDQRELAGDLGLELNYDFNGEAYYTVSGQNSNNSVRLTHAFFKAVDDDGDWQLIGRTDGKVARTIKARDLWKQICRAAWRCADPGLQYDSTINEWHTCPNSGRINASNPCSEYMFLDNTACNLASINLLTLYNAQTRTFDVEAYEHAIELWTIVLEISVLMAAFPSREIAEQSYRFRTLGLGYANLGAMLMQAGIPYDSEEGRAICGAITSILTGRSYATSARMAQQLGAFPGFAENRDQMLRVMRNHRRAAFGTDRSSDAYESLTVRPVPIDHAQFRGDQLNIANAPDVLTQATRAWDDALQLGEQHGYRNAQVTVIAPTGTIGLLMDCDTTGVEPDFALVKFKKLAGGGYFKIANASLKPSLHALGYDDGQIDAIIRHVMGSLSVEVVMPADVELEGDIAPADRTLRTWLQTKGYTSDDLVALENTLPTVFELGFAFNAWSMPEHVLTSLGIDIEAARNDMSFNGLRAMGLSNDQIELLNERVCGTQTIEGAPHLKDEHVPVFDCANKCGKTGQRFIRPQGHIRMMAASQPFISGAISKTINLPAEASIDDVADAYWLSWELGLKANALYRDGSKLSQPLSTKADVDETEEDDDAQVMAEVADEVSADVADVAGVIAASNLADDVTPVDRVEPRQVERIVERIIERPMRRRLPETRQSITHRFNVAKHEGYLTVGLHEDGSPGELFITMSKEGSTIGGLMDSLGTAISVALQYGVPLESLVKKFAYQRFEPNGATTNRDIPFAKSLVDYIFRWLGMQFIPGYREEHTPSRGYTGFKGRPVGLPTTEPPSPAARQPELDSHSERTSAVRSGNNSDASPTAGHGDAGDAHAASDARAQVTVSAIEQTHVEVARRTNGVVAQVSVADSVRSVSIASASATEDTLSQATASMQSDAPPCEVCGSITVRNGACFKCLNCGNSLGCS